MIGTKLQQTTRQRGQVIRVLSGVAANARQLKNTLSQCNLSETALAKAQIELNRLIAQAQLTEDNLRREFKFKER